MRMTRFDNQTISQVEHFDFLVNKLLIENLVHGHCTVGKDWMHKDITSPFHRLYFILDGEGRISGGDLSIPLVPGRIYLIPANSTWTYSCDSMMEQFFIHLKILMMKGMDLFGTKQDCMVIDCPQKVIADKISVLETGTLDGIVWFKSFLFEIIADFIRRYKIDLTAQIERAGKYEELFEFIYSNCSAELQVTDVVQFMHQSQSSVFRGLKTDTGYSIKNCIDNSIISKARELLLLTDLTVKEIAFMLKFKDQYYFSRFFARHTGKPPSEYRKINSFKL